MRKTVLLAGIFAIAVASCGGGGGETGIGSAVSGFYTLTVSVPTQEITSYTVAVDQNGNIFLPEDEIKGTVKLIYNGTGTPMRGMIKTAQLCLTDRCYSLGLTGVLEPNGQELNFAVKIKDYKYDVPWIVVNPLEDRVLSREYVEVPLAGSGTVTVNLPPTMLVRNYVYRKAGAVVEVWQGNVKLCESGNEGGQCTVTVDKDNNRAIIQFSGEVPERTVLRYSLDEVVDINPAIDVNQYKWDGQTNPTVQGQIRVEVRLESEEKLSAVVPVNFRIVGKQP